jgi:phosphonopyruvate decarboxylase
LEIPYSIVDADTDIVKALDGASQFWANNHSPYALLVRKGTFAATESIAPSTGNEMFCATREESVRAIIDLCAQDSLFISTTGMASRELFEIREQDRQGHGADFLTVGGMGCASSIALEVARCHAEKQVVCIDGDGAALMHMGAMATIGSIAPRNLLHIVINNGEHGSTGGQPTISRQVDMCGIARACGYEKVWKISDLAELATCLKDSIGKLTFVEILTCSSYRKDLGRPTTTPLENKADFMERLG